MAFSAPVSFSAPTEHQAGPRREPTPRKEGTLQQWIKADVDDTPQVVERVAAIDVAKATRMVCTRFGHERVTSRRVTKVLKAKATTKGLLELADHLAASRIEPIVLQSTSDYWRPFFYVLKGAGLKCGFNARQVINVPGRPKTEKIDAVWLATISALRAVVGDSDSILTSSVGPALENIAWTARDVLSDAIVWFAQVGSVYAVPE